MDLTAEYGRRRPTCEIFDQNGIANRENSDLSDTTELSFSVFQYTRSHLPQTPNVLGTPVTVMLSFFFLSTMMSTKILITFQLKLG